jgi:hypothetical protein
MSPHSGKAVDIMRNNHRFVIRARPLSVLESEIEREAARRLAERDKR